MKEFVLEKTLKLYRLVSGKGYGRYFHSGELFEYIFQKLKPRDFIHVQGNVMFINPDDPYFVDPLIKHGVYEAYETELIKGELKAGMKFIDIGANLGYYTLIAAHLVASNGKVYSFEPEPGNYNLLEKNVAANGYGNVVCERLAVSDRSGKLELFLCEDNPGDHRTYDSRDGKRSIQIDAITLDDYFKESKERIDLIKMDIQGSEPAALRGMEQLIKRSMGIKLFLELWPRGLNDFGSSPRELAEQLRDLGFNLLLINEERNCLEEVSVDELEEICKRECKDYADHFDLFCVKA